MLLSTLQKEVKKELDEEKVSMAKAKMKERIREIEKLERTLKQAKRRYQELMAMEVDDVI